MAEDLTGILNIQRNLFLEKEELDQWQNFIRNNVPLLLFGANTSSFGIVKQQSLSDADFEIVTGSNTGTVRMVNDSYIIDSDKLVGYLPAFNNLSPPLSDTYYWLKVSHRFYNAEDGDIISIDTSTNTITGDGTKFTDLVRGQVTGVPTRIKFYKEDDYGNEVAVNNTGIYEVNSVPSDTSMVITGDLVAESGNVKYIVVGAYTLGTQLSAAQSSGLFDYDYATLEWVQAVDLSTEPGGLVADKEFWIAAVYYNSGTGDVTIEDKRSQYWTLSFGATLDINDATTSSKGIVQLATDAEVQSNTGGDKVVTSDTGNKGFMPRSFYVNQRTVSGSDWDTTSDISILNTEGYIILDYNDGDNSSGSINNVVLQSPGNLNKNQIIFIDANIEQDNNLLPVINIKYDSTTLYSFNTSLDDRSLRVVLKSDGTDWKVVLEQYDASTSNKGVVELTTITEATGNSDSLAVTPAGLSNKVGDTLKRKIVNIGDWTMDTDLNVTVTHGLVASNIRGVDVIIRDDSGNLDKLEKYNDSTGISDGGVTDITSTLIELGRIASGSFNSNDYSQTSYNRGWITIWYV